MSSQKLYNCYQCEFRHDSDKYYVLTLILQYVVLEYFIGIEILKTALPDNFKLDHYMSC